MGNLDFAELARGLSIWLLPLMVAVILHELAHGFVAWRLGDSTAKDQGRLSLNPISHIDPFGSIVLPLLLIFSGSGIMFGWAKPVPVNFNRLRNPRRDMVLVAAAGPAMNIVLALVAAALLVLTGLPRGDGNWAQLNLLNALILNIVLAVFNMAPVPPLDGGRVLAGLAPRPLGRLLDALEPYGMMIIIVLVFVLPALGIFAFQKMLFIPQNWLFQNILTLVGLR